MTTPAAPLDVVHRFIAFIEAKDLDGALGLVADDVEYDNVPIRKVFGPAGIRGTLAPFTAACSEIDWVIVREAATGDVVMNERIDRFHFPNGWLELPVAGVFEVRDGRIVLWRDYFDLATFTAARAGLG